jgi:hypothetical protein
MILAIGADFYRDLEPENVPEAELEIARKKRTINVLDCGEEWRIENVLRRNFDAVEQGYYLNLDGAVLPSLVPLGYSFGKREITLFISKEERIISEIGFGGPRMNYEEYDDSSKSY